MARRNTHGTVNTTVTAPWCTITLSVRRKAPHSGVGMPTTGSTASAVACSAAARRTVASVLYSGTSLTRSHTVMDDAFICGAKRKAALELLFRRAANAIGSAAFEAPTA
jgi:hypothetical protein